MGGLISLLRDIKTIYKDLKVTLKLTARIVLKVHSIVDDVEQTVQELKAAVKGLSSRIQHQHDSDGKAGEFAFEALVESVESKAISLKTSLVEATSQVFNEDLLSNTQEKWDKVMQYSKQSSAALANFVANSTFNVGGSTQVSGTQQACALEGTRISLSEVNVNDLGYDDEDATGNFNDDRALVPVFREKLHGITNEEEIRDFEILPLDVMDSFWKCDIGCFNIDCVDYQQLPTGRLVSEVASSHSRKKKAKKRTKRSKSGKKAALGVSSSNTTPIEHGQTPAKYHHKNRKQPRENVALELIFLIAVLVEGVAMTNRDVLVRGNVWDEPNRGSWSRTADIIELDD